MGILTIRELEDAPIIEINHNALIERITIVECKNPFCNCGSFKMLCVSKQKINNDTKPLILNFEGDIFSKKIAMFDEVSQNDMAIFKKHYNYLNENLNNSDWEKIFEIFKFNKTNQIKNYDVEQEQKYEYSFSEEHIENANLRISYHEIFPWCEYYFVEQNGNQYEVTETYCKLLSCDCTVVNFVLYHNDKLVDDFDFNYADNEISNSKYTWVVDQILDQFIFANVQLQVRNLIVRCLYGEMLAKPENLLMLKEQLSGANSSFNKPYINVQKNIGRNDKCPCGSGKKFKRCCLKKS